MFVTGLKNGQEVKMCTTPFVSLTACYKTSHSLRMGY